MEPLVNLFIVGAPKCGTTALAHNLGATGQVCIPTIKEPNYFVLKTFTNAPHVRDNNSYNRLFSMKENSYSYYLDASTSYLFDAFAANRIKRFNSKAKIIILLKDPVERMISHYNMEKYLYCRECLNIDQALSEQNRHDYFGSNINPYIGPSLYHDQVKRYLDVFPRENMFIGIVDSKDGFIQELEVFLGIQNIPNKRINESKQIRNKYLAKILKSKYFYKFRRKIPLKFKNLLAINFLFKDNIKESLSSDKKEEYYLKYFREDVKKLEELLELNLSHWKRE